MTFGSTFGRVLSPTFQPKSQAAAGGWWDLNGTITSCIAAYQPKGAADYAASKVNLANPGTLNAADGAAYPTWDAINGWKFDSALTQYLTSAIKYKSSAMGQTYSMILRFSNHSAGTYLIGQNGNYSCLYLRNARTGNLYFCQGNNGSVLTVGGNTISSGVMALAGSKAYLNGNQLSGDIPFNTSSTETTWFSIGAAPYNNGYTNNTSTVYIQACAVYNTALTATQMAALTTAMAAL